MAACEVLLLTLAFLLALCLIGMWLLPRFDRKVLDDLWGPGAPGSEEWKPAVPMPKPDPDVGGTPGSER